ncbi:MAG: EFR1 family ferrodoxin [Oscillospiraceae bacterium]
MISAKKFYVSDKCSGCGKCAERCPLNNIKTAGGKPVWGNDCTHCMACIAGCPNEAIEYGKKTIGKPRYFLDEE